MAADANLLKQWARGWARTRGVGAPIRDGAAWRIEVGAPDQVRRFVFADLSDEVASRAHAIREPWVMLKVCADTDQVRNVLPARWTLRPAGHFMAIDRPMDAGAMTETHAQIAVADGVTFCRMTDPDGQIIAEGRAVRVDDRVIYDRILVGEQHRRRGLGGRVMRALQTAVAPDLPGLLVATAEGRALYETLGWSLHSPYATAVIEG